MLSVAREKPQPLVAAPPDVRQPASLAPGDAVLFGPGRDVSAASVQPVRDVEPAALLLPWVLRIAIALEFLGHGWFAFQGKPAWIPFVTYWGISAESAPAVMRVVGLADFALAIHVLVRPVVPLLAWMTFWGFFTATLRPLTGLSFFDFVERAPNWGAPLALLLLVLHRRRTGQE